MCKQVFRWCYRPGSYALICDSSVRSGKTAAMSCSFVLWAMKCFDKQNFAFCGNTVQAVERNILMPLQQMTDVTYYYKLKYLGSKHILTVSGGGHENDFYIFGGKDESSYKLVQGITLSGVLFDEVALMPESFVQQAIARTLSVDAAKLWFNCNPDSPEHWFYKEWVQKTDSGNRPDVLHLHFEMQDNPVMTPEKIKRTESLFAGVFYDRYIRGLWVVAEGLVYPMFSGLAHIGEPETSEGDYTRLETHSFDPEKQSYTVENQAYSSWSEEALGSPCSLASVPGWELLQASQTIENVEHPLFAVYRNPASNTIDLDSQIGVSVFAHAVGLIQEANDQ